MRQLARLSASVVACLIVGGCANGVGDMSQPARLVSGPPVQDVDTPYDRAIACLAGQKHLPVVVGVGEIADSTGRDAISNDGQGKFITQGAGDMVQTALKTSEAVRVVNRRDPRILINEMQWGLRSPSGLTKSDYYITGSINTLDFLPGASAETSVAGIGPSYRQYRALVGLDLALTDAATSEVVAVAAVHKQIYADEVAFNVGRFFGNTLVQINLDTQQREAMQFALRGMLYYATFQLLKKLYAQHGIEGGCQEHLDQVQSLTR